MGWGSKGRNDEGEKKEGGGREGGSGIDHRIIYFSSATEDTIASGVKRMEAGVAKVKAELKQHPKPQEWADKFAEKMKVFLGEAEDKLKKIKDQYQLMEKKFEELSEYYCFDRKKVSMEEFFGDITQFCKDFEV